MTLGGGTSPAELIDLLGDADPDVRLRAALELGEALHDPAAPAIVERFGRERDFYIRETLTWAALRMPVAALPHVRAALGSPRWLARLQALHTLSKVGSLDDAARLVPLVADPVDAVAAHAYWAAAQTRDPRVVPALVAQLSRGDSEHQNSLTVALGLFGAAAVPALVAALRGGTAPEIRRHAADTLSHMGSPDADDAAPALAAAVADPDEGVRLAALNALGQLVPPSAWAVVDEAVGSPEPRLRHLAQRLSERRPTNREMRLAELRRRQGGGLGEAPAEVQPVVAAGPWPGPDLSLVTVEGGPQAEALRPKLARQVEYCRPRYLSRTDIPEEVLEQAFAEADAEALESGRPAAVAA
ncbi:MAG: HEAT repeat domain-containing protein, partial [Actinomycetota bacterium]